MRRRTWFMALRIGIYCATGAVISCTMLSRRTTPSSGWEVVPDGNLGGVEDGRVSGPGGPGGPDVTGLRAAIEKLRPLAAKLAPPGPHDWLARHDEPGQTFEEYVVSRPVVPRGRRSVIYICPLGDFTKTQRRIVDLTAEFMGRYFDRPVKLMEGVPLSAVPARARRVHPSWGDRQVLATYVLYDVLKPALPADAAAAVALTASDLWPGRGWNFVFGQASLRERVGVWSIYRNGDPDESESAFRLCLLRTIKTATHETGHMFSMLHCTKYECNMCGSNHREESDRRPLALCPECVAKVAWATGADLAGRYRSLEDFARARGLDREADDCRRRLEAISPE
jgi:archaemetzincin